MWIINRSSTLKNDLIRARLTAKWFLRKDAVKHHKILNGVLFLEQLLPEKTRFEWSKTEIMPLNVSEIKKKSGKRLTTHPNLRSVGCTTFGIFFLIRQIFNLKSVNFIISTALHYFVKKMFRRKHEYGCLFNWHFRLRCGIWVNR